jgi:hypothetical protein
VDSNPTPEGPPQPATVGRRSDVTPAVPSPADGTAATPAAAALAALDAISPPTLGKTIAATPGAGTVRVHTPGGDGFVELENAGSLPVGTIFDATQGEVVLRAALPGGRVQNGRFHGAQFEVRQSPGGQGMTDLFLRGGDFSRCARSRNRRATAPVAVASQNRKRAVRKLWGSDRSGRFRTHGRESVATVRGTRWLTEDRCDGTLTRVTEGAVDVKPRRGGKTVRVKAGRTHLVRSAR